MKKGQKKTYLRNKIKPRVDRINTFEDRRQRSRWCLSDVAKRGLESTGIYVESLRVGRSLIGLHRADKWKKDA